MSNISHIKFTSDTSSIFEVAKYFIFLYFFTISIASVKDKLIYKIEEDKIKLFCDAQTSGGLLISIPSQSTINIKEVKENYGIDVWEIGEINSEYNEKINII